MKIRKLLIANRGEVAIRIARAAADMDIATVAIYAEDDAESLHTRVSTEAHLVPGRGVPAYLDMDQLIAVAESTGCDAVHPGYGFLSESEQFARLCEDNGICFVGPSSSVLGLLGDKARARGLAQECDVPVAAGTAGATTLDEARDFQRRLGSGAALMIKAIAGGGGRGMRIVHEPDELERAFGVCQKEARAAFGNDALYVEELIPRARHIEVQVIGDGCGNATHLWERECSLQRRNQKLIEIAPSPSLTESLRERVVEAALRLARAVNYRSLGTFEFLVDTEAEHFYFMEANPRLQVEHTVTEEVTGVDLVRTQLKLAAGATLEALDLTQEDVLPPRGYAVQLRVNMETMDARGNARPAGGTLAVFEPPTGPGLRVDTFGYSGYKVSPLYDSLLAKLIVHSSSPHYADAVRRAYRGLCQFRIDGVRTNIGFLQNLLSRPEVKANEVYTRFVDDYMQDLIGADTDHPRLYFSDGPQAAADADVPASTTAAPPGTQPATAPMQGLLVEHSVAEGDTVREGQPIALVEAMKMQHVITAPVSGIVRALAADTGDTVAEKQPLVFIEPAEVGESGSDTENAVDPDHIRPDLAEILERHALTLDAARPESVAKRHSRGQRTARENIADLCDPDSFIEYGNLTFAAQRKRRSVDDLIRNTPADGLIAGMGSVNGDLFDDDSSRCMVLAYDYTVLAGTQGTMNHKKTDRVLTVAEDQELPVVFFAEGGGGRPGDTDNGIKVAGLDGPSFLQYARLSGLAPRISIVTGRCFAGNAVMAGTSDLMIATRDTSIGMAGPAMIEGGGLGVFTPEEVGPSEVQWRNGVIDSLVADEAEAVRTARQLLSYFQGSVGDWDCQDQRLLRSSIPENRLRSYDVRGVIDTLADTGTVLELRRGFGPAMITALIRIEGRPMGLIANDPRHLGGAIDAAAADKAARFMQLCDAYDVPMISLCDTPGFMVGPDAEQTALVRHTARMFVTAANMSVPLFTIVLRKGYGLGAQGMTGGSFHAPVFNVSWPTGEFGGMNLEGAVRLAYRKELGAVEDPAEQQALYEKLVAELYERGKALNMATALEIDGVIDPADTRRWIVRGLRSVPKPAARRGKKRSFIDTW